MVPEGSGSNDGRDEITFGYSLEREAQPALAIVNAVAWVKGVDGRDLDPLQQVIDIGALAALLRQEQTEFTRSPGEEEPVELQVTFPYEGYVVTVTEDEVRVSEP